MPQFFHDAFCKSPGRVGRGSRKFPEPLFAFQPGALPFGVLPGGEGQLALAVFTGDFPAQHASYQRQAQGAFRCGGAWAEGSRFLHGPSCIMRAARWAILSSSSGTSLLMTQPGPRGGVNQFLFQKERGFPPARTISRLRST